jgi:hypothetical protein
MYRRRRTVREIPFSFDSFLDVVTNVVGIIIRLILVVWVAARSYTGIVESAGSSDAPAAAVADALPADPLQTQLEQQRRDLAELQARLLAQLRRVQEGQAEQAHAETELRELTAAHARLEEERATLARSAATHQGAAQMLALSSAELQKRCQQLAAEIRELEKRPPPQLALRYRTPVSHPLQSEELMFECHNGRVAFVDLSALLADARHAMEDQKTVLRKQWTADGTTAPVGAFRLHYVVERDRGMMDLVGPSSAPDPQASYSFGLSMGDVQPVTAERGEDVSAALAESSEFRQIVDHLDPNQSAVTFWVYPDSFPIFRRLRDYLYEHDVTVAGRPLPEGVPIAVSRRGSISRGQ